MSWIILEWSTTMPINRKRRVARGNNRKNFNIPQKANKILNFVLVVFVLFCIKLWYLGVIQYDQKLEESMRPQFRTVVEPAVRGTIRDRFNVPLAINKVQYNVAISYAQIQEVPRVHWKIDDKGQRIRHYARKKHVEDLSRVLGEELDLDPYRVEDLIYGRAAIFPNVPYVIKADVSEREYFRLKMLEKDWTGILSQIVPRRSYPHGKVGCDVVGFIGAISGEKYRAIVEEINTLRENIAKENFDPSLPEGKGYLEMVQRLEDLEEKAYTINDDIGRAGVEKTYEENLRGFHGEKAYFVDARGRFLRVLDYQPPLSGQRVMLTISEELQEFAEQLLIQNEKIRDGLSRHYNQETGKVEVLKQPWIKGGAIIALEPKTGEVLALASYPRYNPNDFIFSGDPEDDSSRRLNICRWFENERYIAALWDNKLPLQRELSDDVEEDLILTWEAYLDFILLDSDSVYKALKRSITKIKDAVAVQESCRSLMKSIGQNDAKKLFNFLYNKGNHKLYGMVALPDERRSMQASLDTFGDEGKLLCQQLDRFVGDIDENYNKLMLVDLCGVVVSDEKFSRDLLDVVGNNSLGSYRKESAAKEVVLDFVKEGTLKIFQDIDFKIWRENNQKGFLKQKREEEEKAKKYARPYIEYIDKQEKLLFNEFWEGYKDTLLTVFVLGENPFLEMQEPSLAPYVDYFISWAKEIKMGAHRVSSWWPAYRDLQKAATKLSPYMSRDYFASMRGFKDLTRPLLGAYRNVRNYGKEQREKDLAAAFYPLNGFGYSRSYAYRQALSQGSIFKIVTAYEALVQRYLALKESLRTIDDLNPLTIVDRAHRVSGGDSWVVAYTLAGKAIPQQYKGGRLLKSMRNNIGKIDVVRAIENTSNVYFGLLAGDHLKSPEDLSGAAYDFSYGHKTGINLPGEYKGVLPDDLSFNRSGLYSFACGQHSLVVTPLQTSVMFSALANGGKVIKPQIVKLLAGKELVKPFVRQNRDHKKDFIFREFDQLPTYHIKERAQKTQITYVPTEIKQEVFLPEEVRTLLMKAMRRVVVSKGEGYVRNYYDQPGVMRNYGEMKKYIVGKTSTAEFVDRIDLSLHKGINIYNDVWFGAIAFEGDIDNVPPYKRFSDPELVVVVCLRFGDYGKEAAPLVTQIIKKWREIKEKHAYQNITVSNF